MSIPVLPPFELSEDQISLLSRFLDTFLENSNNKRISDENVLDNIHKTVNDIFVEHVGYKVPERDLIDLCIKKGYTFRTILEPYTELKIPTDIGFYEHVYEEVLDIRKQRGLRPHKIHISISASKMKLLRKSQLRIPFESGNVEKTLTPWAEMKLEIREFFGIYDGIRIEDLIPKKDLPSLDEGG